MEAEISGRRFGVPDGKMRISRLRNVSSDCIKSTKNGIGFNKIWGKYKKRLTDYIGNDIIILQLVEQPTR